MRFIRSAKDFWSGIMFLAIALSTIVIAQDYPMGSAGRMGPGFFPAMLGWILAAIALVVLIGALTKPGEALEPLAWKDLVLVLAAVLLFGFLVRGAGLAIAIPLLIVVSAFGSVKFRWKPTLALAAGATVFCVLLFVKALGLPLPVLGSWFGA
ncbi:small permease of tripartite tricarboxylate transporter [Massilia sp. KIM]|uniref:tripartite tricarboxylate transporter TctB family protein n=1 Tax=Massilia sp. KIM TaxID=1955422 RepID=UPI00098F617D|nr:tripartite tricarboxylate transporter TctB family protein [Massilia sp. KIM]OON64082.1 small permease of tripartite tricarboxylate transporter [Massilia sp. KIM]